MSNIPASLRSDSPADLPGMPGRLPLEWVAELTGMRSEKLIESIGAKIPFVGQVVDDVSQGVGAGIMTSTVGHAGIQRCFGRSQPGGYVA